MQLCDGQHSKPSLPQPQREVPIQRPHGRAFNETWRVGWILVRSLGDHVWFVACLTPAVCVWQWRWRCATVEFR